MLFDPTDPAGVASALVAENTHLTLATAGSDGAPWASRVWFASRGFEWFVWASKPGARHSRNLALDARASLVIFDSRQAPGEGSALYASVVARLVDDAAFDEALRVYNERSIAQGLEVWDAADLREPARHRLYAATVTEAFVLDDHDERVRVR